jgi:hypothetical protein
MDEYHNYQPKGPTMTTTLQASFGTNLQGSFSEEQESTQGLDSFSDESCPDDLTDWSNGLELTASDF